MFNGMQWPMAQAQPDVSGSTIVHSSGSNAMVWQGDSGPYYRGGAVTCQVEGCTADLFLEEKPYCVKKRICSEHMRAECIAKPGDTMQLWRFCFQCGKLEPISEFDGQKRSCRARLQRRKLPPRRSMSWAPGCVPRNTVSSSSSEHFFQYQQQEQQQQQALLQRLQELQRQQAQLAAPAMCSTPALSVASAGVPASVASNPEAMALLHEQQLLVEQKKAEVQALRDALAREGARLAGGLNGSTTPPECASGRMSFTGSEAMGSQQASPVASLGPAASSAAACAAMAAPLQPQISSGFLAASEQAQAQSATTAAAAAAALAGSSTWPFTSAAGSSAVPVAVSQAPVLQHAADLDICDELDSLASVFDAELADVHHAALEPPTTQMALQQLQQQEELVTAAIASALAAHQRQAADVSPSASGALNAAANQLPSGMSLPGTSSASQSLSWGTGMPMLQPQQGGPQDAQIQQLMQAVQSLHQSVQELSLRVGSNSAPLVYSGQFVNNMQGL